MLKYRVTWRLMTQTEEKSIIDKYQVAAQLRCRMLKGILGKGGYIRLEEGKEDADGNFTATKLLNSTGESQP